MQLAPAVKAARVHRFGPSSVIQIDDVEKPQPEADQVLVEVHAAGVGPWDAWIRSGKSVLPQPLPLTLGSDFSGVVTASGAQATSWSPGDEVFGITGPQYTGASADYAAVPQTMVAHKPRRLSHVEAASVPVVAVTALQMLGEHARVMAGERVLILGAAGAVGAYAVQLARTLGVHVIGTVRRNEEVAYVRRLGASEVVDVATARMEDVVGPVDVVIDTVGGELANRSMALLSRGGRLVTAVPDPNQELAARYGVSAKFMLVDVRTEPLTLIAGLFEKGELITHVGDVMPLADIRAAHDMLEGKRAHRRGKIVLALTPDAEQSPALA